MPEQNGQQSSQEGSLGRIEKLERGLYRRATAPPEPQRHGLRKEREPEGASGDWTSPELSVPVAPHIRMPLAKKILILSILFFVGSVAFVSFLLLRGSTTISSENIQITVNGPVSVGGGEELSLQVLISNTNPVALELADFIVEYPPGARDPSDRSKALTRTRESAGSIPPGGVSSRTVRVVLFGEENSEQTLAFALEYRVADSNAIFVKEKKYSIPLTAAPVTLGVELPQEIGSGEDVEAVITVRSNTDAVIDDALLQVLYPPGFVLMNASPASLPGNNRLWRLGDLPPGGERTIRIRGQVTGQDDELKTFTVTVGAPGPDSSDAISVPYNSAQKTLALRRPSIEARISLDGTVDGDITARRGQRINGSVRIVNNLPTRVLDTSLSLRFVGDVLDRASVQAITGLYRSLDNIIVWDSTSEDFDGTLEPGESKDFRFSFAIAKQIVSGSDTDMKLALTVSGTRIAASGDRAVNAQAERVVRLATEAGLSARAVYGAGPFTNVGPIPPIADKETTYTIIWAVTNTLNELRDVSVRATLPQHIRYTGTTAPASEQVSFDPSTNTVEWRVGTVPAGTGGTRPVREVAFQIGFVPSLSQVGEAPRLLGETLLRAIDDTAQVSIEARRDPLTTVLVTDRTFRDGDDIVRQQ
ncbi:MAG: hypothetical protein HYS59_00260 [Candidatus Vogelbacteria bacterium]|nr:hypothetical protein [Candidatus Vogelbacteria bacterium]